MRKRTDDMVIRPTIFDGNVSAFFTNKFLGADPETISRYVSIKRSAVYIPRQEHSDRVFFLEDGLVSAVADAVVTRLPNVLIGVQVADCVPILIHDVGRSVVGAVHAGWKGTVLGIVKKTIAGMIERFGSDPRDMMIAIGPSIRGCCYRVGADVGAAVVATTGRGDYIELRKGALYLDLAKASVVQAYSMGVPLRNVWMSADCTHCNPLEYHSFRYHKNYAGRQGGFIGLIPYVSDREALYHEKP